MERLSDYHFSLTKDFTRYAIAKALVGAGADAADAALKRWPDSPEVARAFKAVAGSSATGNWGAQDYGFSADVVPLLDAQTVPGRLTGAMRVPFRTTVVRSTTPPTVDSVAKGGAKPVTDMGFDTVSIDYSVIAGISVLPLDLARSTRPNAEAVIAQRLISAEAALIDQRFLDPSVAAVTDEHPASITHGATTHASTGDTAADITADVSLLVSDLTAGGVYMRSPYLAMRPRSAVSLSLLRLTDSGRELSIGGIPILTSIGSPSGQVTLLDAAEVIIADEGEMRVDRSGDANIDMSGGDSPTFSAFQKNSVAIRVERRIAWALANPAGVAYLTSVTW